MVEAQHPLQVVSVEFGVQVAPNEPVELVESYESGEPVESGEPDEPNESDVSGELVEPVAPVESVGYLFRQNVHRQPVGLFGEEQPDESPVAVPQAALPPVRQ